MIRQRLGKTREASSGVCLLCRSRLSPSFSRQQQQQRAFNDKSIPAALRASIPRGLGSVSSSSGNPFQTNSQQPPRPPPRPFDNANGRPFDNANGSQRNSPPTRDNPFSRGANPGFGRGNSDFSRGNSDFSRGNNGFSRGGNDLSRSGNDFNRGNNGFSRGNNGFGRGTGDLNRGGNDFGRSNNGFNSSNNGFSRPPNNDFSRSDNSFESGSQEWGQLSRRNSPGQQAGGPPKIKRLDTLSEKLYQRPSFDPRSTSAPPKPTSAVPKDLFSMSMSDLTKFQAGLRKPTQEAPAPPPEPKVAESAPEPTEPEPTEPEPAVEDTYYVPSAMTDYAEDRTEKKARKKSAKPKNTRYGRDRYEDEDDDGYGYEEDFENQSRREQKQKRKKERRQERQEMMELEYEEAAAAPSGPTPIRLPELITIANLGRALGRNPSAFVDELAEMGFEDISAESMMTGDTAALVAQEYGFDPTVDSGDSMDLKPRPQAADLSLVPPRPPIVTIMGHVDHGKTTLLDWMRKSSVAAGEHGGITQHIGAFSVKLSAGKVITFLDTPGHAAFLTMRQRGANVTDIVILVVAADDSVKPQTLEALKHARAAKVPIIVAINKVDKDEANVDQVKADLSRHGVEIEDYGGDVQVVCVSGKTGKGMDDLEENILTLSEVLDMRAEPDGMAEGWVLESSIKPIGRVATVLVTRGTLRKGDVIVAGSALGRVRLMRNEAGVEVEEAGPATPVEILGWKDQPPSAGDSVLQAPDESVAARALRYRNDKKEREEAAAEQAAQEKAQREKAELEALAKEIEEGTKTEEDTATKTVSFNVKGDVMGSVEAVTASIMALGNNEVQPRILRSSPGQISEFDVEHAAASKCYIVNFNTPVPGAIQRMAKDAKVTILEHNVIYHLIDEVKAKMSEMLAPKISYKILGEADVLQVFTINLKGRAYKNIAGVRIRNGQVTRNGSYRVLRKGEIIFDGKLSAMKQGKKDVTEMRKGTECGLEFEEFQDLESGDQIQMYEEIKEKRYL